MEGGQNVALTDRVYDLATTANGPIKPGDLLTTSEVLGHAMKATDFVRWQGAVIGKAMSSLEKGEGLVLVLVNLQRKDEARGAKRMDLMKVTKLALQDRLKRFHLW